MVYTNYLWWWLGDGLFLFYPHYRLTVSPNRFVCFGLEVFGLDYGVCFLVGLLLKLLYQSCYIGLKLLFSMVFVQMMELRFVFGRWWRVYQTRRWIPIKERRYAQSSSRRFSMYVIFTIIYLHLGDSTFGRLLGQMVNIRCFGFLGCFVWFWPLKISIIFFF